MKTIVLAFSLIALAASSQAAPMEQKCREMVGKEQSDVEGRGHAGLLQAQRFSDCTMNAPH